MWILALKRNNNGCLFKHEFSESQSQNQPTLRLRALFRPVKNRGSDDHLGLVLNPQIRGESSSFSSSWLREFPKYIVVCEDNMIDLY